MRARFKELSKDTIVYGIGNVAGAAVNVFLVPIYTRVFSIAQYGILDLLATAGAVLSIFIIFGFDGAEPFFFFNSDEKSDRQVTISTSFYFKICFSIVICATGYIFSASIAKYALKDLYYLPFLKLVFLTTPMIAAGTFFSNILRMKFCKWKYLFLTVGRALFGSGLIIYLVICAKMGLMGVFLGQLFSSLLFVFIGLFMVMDYIKFKFSLERLIEMLKYGAPLFFAAICLWIVDFSDRYFLLHYSNAEAVGLYSVAAKISLIVVLVTGAFRTAWAPFGFSVAKTADAPRFYAKVCTYYLAVLAFLAVLTSLFAKEILFFLTPPGYHQAARAVGFLNFAAIGYGIIPVITMGLFLSKKTYFNIFAFGLAAISNLILNYVLIPKFSYMGAAIATLTSFFIADVLFYGISQKCYYIPFELSKIFTILGISFFAIFAGMAIDKNPAFVGWGYKAILVFLMLGCYRIFNIFGGRKPYSQKITVDTMSESEARRLASEFFGIKPAEPAFERRARMEIYSGVIETAKRCLRAVKCVLTLTFYYFLAAVFLLFFAVVNSLKKKAKLKDPVNEEIWQKLFSLWSKTPAACIYKTIEAAHFIREPEERPSVEIGCHSGEHSACIFNQRKMDVGIEYVPFSGFLKFAESRQEVFEDFLSCDIYDISLRDGTVKSLFIVHALDEVTRGIDGAIKEASRVLMPGGKVVFSCFSDYFPEQNIVVKVLGFLKARKLAKSYFEKKYVSIGINNFYSEREWKEILRKHDLHVEKFRYFIPRKIALLFDMVLESERSLNRMGFGQNKRIFAIFANSKFLKPHYRNLLKAAISGVLSCSLEQDGRERAGNSIFVVARKEKEEAPCEEKPFRLDDVLQCPICKGEVKVHHASGEDKSRMRKVAVCDDCKANYPCAHNVPIMLKSASYRAEE